MRKVCVAFAFLITVATLSVSAQEGFGLGIVLGEPTGISAKLWFNDSSAMDAAAAWSFRGPNNFQGDGVFYLHADYLFHSFDVFPVNEGLVPLYFGLGGMLTLEQDPQLGIRAPVGIEYIFESAPLEIFLEVAPGIGLFPATRFEVSGGLGIRYYF